MDFNALPTGGGPPEEQLDRVTHAAVVTDFHGQPGHRETPHSKGTKSRALLVASTHHVRTPREQPLEQNNRIVH